LNTYNAVIQTITRGHEWIRDVFGTKHLPKTAWRIDPFGSTTTMSKLYKDSGYNSTYVTGTLLTSRVIMRMPRELQNEMRKKKHLEIMWQTTSGKIFTHIMDLQYCVPEFVLF
jgi:alpha-mannosidase II/lysosomal alpha-mannosidase